MCGSIVSVDASGCDASNVVDMRGMFLMCKSLTTVSISNWDTSSVKYLGRYGSWGVFSYCSSLKSLDLSGWDTSHVVDMDELFYACESLESLDLTGWDTSQVDVDGWGRTMHDEFWQPGALGMMFARCDSLSDTTFLPSVTKCW